MKPSPPAMELQARRDEAWGERNARTALANTARLSAWEAKRALILERDLPADHAKRIPEGVPEQRVLTMKARTP